MLFPALILRYLRAQYDIYKPYGSPEAWTYKMSMPTGRTRLTSAALAGKIYAIGGVNYDGEQRTVEEYDPATDTWQSIKSMLTPRELLASAAAGGKLYVSGGRLDNQSLAAVEAYATATSQSNAMPWIPLLLLGN